MGKKATVKKDAAYLLIDRYEHLINDGPSYRTVGNRERLRRDIRRMLRKAAKDAAKAEREHIVKQLSDYEEAARRQPQHTKALTLAALVKIAGSAKP